jgi:hypothetical protein
VVVLALVLLAIPTRAAATEPAELQIAGIRLTDVLLLVLTAAALLLTWAITAYQWRLTRKQNAIQLHAEYYSIEHYVNVVSAVGQVRLKWLSTPDEKERATYRRLVAAGWAPAALGTGETTPAVRFRLYVRQDDRANVDRTKAHYHEPASAGGLSEHQAVAALLHFWSRLAGLLDAKAVDRQLAKEFFAPAYEYNREFLGSLRETIELSIIPGDTRPAWLDHTRALDRFFG